MEYSSGSHQPEEAPLAKSKVLEDLFTGLVNELARQIKEGRQVLDKSGEVQTVSPDAATMNVVRQLLKDNGIEAPENNPDLGKLRDSLPFDTDPASDSTHLN